MDPLRFEPQFVSKIWGGRRLETALRKSIPPGNIGESWEISGHPHHLTRACSGGFQGMDLYRIAEHSGPEVFGDYAEECSDQFPLLLKFIDASDVLSVQVHPDDAYAQEHEDSLGKSEAWIILDCEPKSFLYRGFRDGCTLKDFDRLLPEGRLEEILKPVPVSPGDCIDLPAGTVHAIGSGILLCEIQQSSDVTYRVYDWNRMGADGKPRPLHVERARDVMDFGTDSDDKATADVSRADGGTLEVLIDSDKFRLERLIVEKTIPLKRCPGLFHLLCVIGGEGAVFWEEGSAPLRAGDSLLVPAGAKDVTLSAGAGLQVAVMSLPPASSSRHRGE